MISHFIIFKIIPKLTNNSIAYLSLSDTSDLDIIFNLVKNVYIEAVFMEIYALLVLNTLDLTVV